MITATIWFLIAAVMFGSFLFWVWMLVHAIKFQPESQKLAWVVVIVFVPLVGPFIYLLFGVPTAVTSPPNESA
jgi:hypothetical protein